MYLDNKYTTLYNKIISKAKSRNFKSRKEAKTSLGYVERHHIRPASLGGTNNQDNLVYLTPREHLICHRLLVKMTIGVNHKKMILALGRMLSENNFQSRALVTSRLYEYIRTLRMNITGSEHHNYGKKRSKDWIETRRKKYTGRGNPNFGKRYKIPDTSNYNNSGTNNPMFGKKHAAHTIELIRGRAGSRERKNCPNCGLLVDTSNYARWHGDRCRTKE